MQTLKFMFMARIDDPDFFLPQNQNKKLNKWIDNTPNDIDPNLKEEVQKHKHIRIKFWENILLYISDSCLGFIIPYKFW